jgi:dTDP-4-dehydrorhamnose reductase
MSGAKFVFISTDAVFDGSQGNYQESDPVSPASVYGRTKADAELAVLEANPSSLILRVNFHGWSPSGRRSLSEFFFNRLSEGNATPGFTDVVVSTMYAGDLVSAAIELVGADSSGIVHLASREAISKYSFGQKVARRFGWDPDLVLASSSRAHLTVARGSALDLDVSLATKIIGRPLPAQDDSLDALFADFENGFRARLREAMPSQEETA